jgi:hypothetical protein
LHVGKKSEARSKKAFSAYLKILLLGGKVKTTPMFVKTKALFIKSKALFDKTKTLFGTFFICIRSFGHMVTTVTM